MTTQTIDPVTGIANGTLDLDTDNPGAAVAFVALALILLAGAGGIAAFLWFFLQVTR